MTAHSWIQFSIGRIVAYFAVGLVENAVPSYNAETSPAAARGLLAGSIMVVTSLGNLWGAGMSRAYQTETSNNGWLIPTAMQFIPAIGLLALVPFTPESPRWLVLKGHKSAAKAALDKIRPKQDVDSGATEVEVNAIEQLIEESLASEKGSWLDIFRGNYLRRTWVWCSVFPSPSTSAQMEMIAELMIQIACTLFVLEQTNGNQFVQSYAATFYVQQGLGSKSFTYATLGQVVGVVGCAAGLILFDISGRRAMLIYGSAVCTFLLFLASGLGQSTNPSQSNVNTIIACFIINPAFTRISASNCAFLTGVEIGGVRMRKKIMVSDLRLLYQS